MGPSPGTGTGARPRGSRRSRAAHDARHRRLRVQRVAPRRVGLCRHGRRAALRRARRRRHGSHDAGRATGTGRRTTDPTPRHPLARRGPGGAEQGPRAHHRRTGRGAPTRRPRRHVARRGEAGHGHLRAGPPALRRRSGVGRGRDVHGLRHRCGGGGRLRDVRRPGRHVRARGVLRAGGRGHGRRPARRGERRGAVPEVLGGAGVLVTSRDAFALAGAIAAVLGDPARRTAMAEAGRRRLAELDLPNAADRFVDLLCRVRGQPTARRR